MKGQKGKKREGKQKEKKKGEGKEAPQLKFLDPPLRAASMTLVKVDVTPHFDVSRQQ